MRLPCFTLQPAAVQTIPLWEEREGSQRFALSFLTELRPRRARVLQNECHHLKEVTVVGAGVGVSSQLHTISGLPSLREQHCSELISRTTSTPTSLPKTSHRICRIQPGSASTTCQLQVQQLNLGGAMTDYLVTYGVADQPCHRHSVTIPYTGDTLWLKRISLQTTSNPFLESQSQSTHLQDVL